MNKIKNIILTLPAVITLLCSGSTNAQNLLVNGDFELITGSQVGVADFVFDVDNWNYTSLASSMDYDAYNINTSTAFWENETPGISDSPLWTNGLAGAIHSSRQLVAGGPAHESDLIDVSGMTEINIAGLVVNPELAANVDPDPSGAIAAVFLKEITSSGASAWITVATASERTFNEFSTNIVLSAGVTDVQIGYGFLSEDASSNGRSSALMVVDGLSLTAVPEPSSALLLGLSSLALIVRRKRA